MDSKKMIIALLIAGISNDNRSNVQLIVEGSAVSFGETE